MDFTCAYNPLETFTVDSISHFDKLDETYKKAVLILLNEIKAAKKLKEKLGIFDIFTAKYTVVPYLWIYGYHLKTSEGNFQDKLLFIKQSFKHFYSQIVFTTVTKHGYQVDELIPFQETYEWPLFNFLENAYKTSENERFKNKTIISQYIENGLTFPHKHLKKLFEICDEFSDHPIPKYLKEEYKKVVEFHFEKCNVDNFHSNYQKWIENLFEFGETYAIQTIEYTLAKHYDDKNLWKCWITAMQKRNNQIAAHIYKRYINLFVDDVEIKNEYGEILIKNTIDYDDYSRISPMEPYFFNPKLSFIPQEKTIKTKCKLTKILHQTFCISSPLISYLIICANLNVQQKLMKICKYFVLKFKNRGVCCYHLRISYLVGISGFHQESLKINSEEIESFDIPKFSVSNRFYFDHNDSTMLQNFILRKIDKCDAKFIDIRSQNLTWNEFLFLVNSKKVVKIKLWKNNILNINGDIATPEEIVFLLPNSYSIEFTHLQDISNDSIKNLTNLNRKIKLKRFHLYFFDAIIIPEAYCKFLKKHAAPNGYFHVLWTTASVVPREHKNEFNLYVKEFIAENWKGNKIKPWFSIS